INDNFTTADVLCGGHDDLSHCQKGFALDTSATINKDIIQPEDLEQIFAGEKAAMPSNEDKDSKSHDKQKIGISASSVESNTGYLAVLAIIRLLLLTFPLTYAAYLGTKVPCVVVQFLFHGITAMIVVSHMLAVLIVNPSSIDIPPDDGSLDPPMTLGAIDDTNSTHNGDAWTLLSLSLVSILLHFLIVLHVRSTGPTSAYEEQMTMKRKRKKLAYAMNGDTRRMAGFHGKGSLGKPLISGQNNYDDDDDDDEGGFADGSFSPLLLPDGNGNTPSREKSIKERLMCLPDQYEAFVSEAQLRLDNARRMWSHRLEVMTSNHNNSLNNSTHGESNGNNGAITDSPGKNFEALIHTAASNASKLVPLKPDPFRVLLQLFAYEDVWTNDRLDLAFSSGNTESSYGINNEGSTALAFYAPQLLSFLLHGAYLDISAKLEEWILKKCSEDLHFAHRCFWFLRAWCLGDTSKGSSKPKLSRNGSTSSLGGGDDVDFISLEPLDSKSQSMKKLRGVEPNLYLSYSEGKGTLRYDYLPPQINDSENTSLHGIDPPEESLSSKFSPDERVLIEQLLRRVIECGSRPAYVTQYGSIEGTAEEESDSQHDDFAFGVSPSALATSVEQGLVPVDPRTGWHSKSHLDAIASPRRFVADESIALSTNERVPCIVALEVIDYGSSVSSVQGNQSSDRTITSDWVNTPRPPKRHSTLMDKVANYTQERLRNTIDHLSHHGDGKMNLERRLSEYLGAKGSPLYVSTDISEHSCHSEHDEEAPIVTKMAQRDSNGFEMCTSSSPPPPPLGSPRSNSCGEDQRSSPRSQSPISSLHYHAVDDDNTDPPLLAPRTPVRKDHEADDVESPMGQWSTPLSAQKRQLKFRKRNKTSAAKNSIVEEEEENNGSPQAKQRKKVAFPPSSESMSRTADEENHTIIPSETQADVDGALLRNIAPTVVFKEDWKAKTERLRKSSIHGSHPGWRLLPILVKSNDDLRQEQLMSQLIQRMALILAKANVPVWLYPYEIVALTGRGGIIECVPDTISIDSLKRNDPDFKDLKNFFEQHFGPPGSDELADAKANFVESLAAYSVVCFLMQIKDRHNGNILLTNKGRIVHIDFGFYFLSSPGKNSGFESAPFKLTRDFVKLMDGPDSRTFAKFRELCYKTFIELRKHCYQIILLVEMLTEGNEDLACFRDKPDEAVRQLKHRFRLDLNDNGIRKYVDELVDESLENWRTRWYDRYQKYCVGVY
ncbi:hypothetical protein ACHAWC_009304, partial [Mediolabrus comicus]